MATSIPVPSDRKDRTQHPWRFFRAGGVDQVSLRQSADLLNLAGLDQKLWVALACPTRGLEFDTKTLDLIDSDGDGRIRVPELLAAIEWSSQVLTDLNELIAGADSIPLASFNSKTTTGAAVLAGAKRILHNLGKESASSISAADVADTARIFAATKFNGDGIVPADSAPDAATQASIADIIATAGGLPDRSGKVGVDQAHVDAFFAEGSALLQWQAESTSDKTILPFNEATAAANAAVLAVKPKVDDYFARCKLAAFDSRATGPLNRAEAEFVALSTQQLTIESGEIAKLPLARIEASRPLPLAEGINPAWAGALSTLVTTAVHPLYGSNRASLSETDWQQLQARLAPYQAWLARKPLNRVEKLGLPRLHALISSAAKEQITKLIQQDAALAAENAQIATVEKAILFRRDLYRLLVNFVNFSDFYSGKGAIFQAGTLYLDGRSCDLCLTVADVAKHGALAGLSAAYLAYCECSRPGGAKLSIVAAFTDGDSDHLLVGRNGIFYDRQGRDWDAAITKIVANPISIREAFWAPYKKFVRLIEEQIAKRAAAADTLAQGKLASAAGAVATADQTKPAAPAVEPKKMDVGTVAAIGVAVGGIGALITGVLTAFFGLGAWMPIGLIALLLMISGPSMLLAYLKLRQRNLGPILDANGWAINGRARINVPFGRALTDVASLPPGSERSLDDPYAEEKRPWRRYVVLGIIVLAALGWYLGKLDSYLPGKVKSTSVLGTNAPAFKPAQPEATAPVATQPK